MARERNVRTLVVSEDVIQQLLQPDILRFVTFADVRTPELVVFAEIGFDGVSGEGGLDVCFAAATVAGVDAVGFAEEFFYDWDEGLGGWEGKVGEGDAGCGEATVERTGVVALR